MIRKQKCSVSVPKLRPGNAPDDKLRRHVTKPSCAVADPNTPVPITGKRKLIPGHPGDSNKSATFEIEQAVGSRRPQSSPLILPQRLRVTGEPAVADFCCTHADSFITSIGLTYRPLAAVNGY